MMPTPRDIVIQRKLYNFTNRRLDMGRPVSLYSYRQFSKIYDIKPKEMGYAIQELRDKKELYFDKRKKTWMTR